MNRPEPDRLLTVAEAAERLPLKVCSRCRLALPLAGERGVTPRQLAARQRSGRVSGLANIRKHRRRVRPSAARSPWRARLSPDMGPPTTEEQFMLTRAEKRLAKSSRFFSRTEWGRRFKGL